MPKEFDRDLNYFRFKLLPEEEQWCFDQACDALAMEIDEIKVRLEMAFKRGKQSVSGLSEPEFQEHLKWS